MKTNIKVKNEPIPVKNFVINSNQSKDLQELSICTWCEKLGNQSFKLQTDNGELKILCSENCFNQYRRASFKKTQHSKITKIHQIIKTKRIVSDKEIKSINIQTENNTNRKTIFSSNPHHSSSFYPPPFPTNIHYFQSQFLPPPISFSSLYQSPSNYTYILPLPTPSHKYSPNMINQECQTELFISENQTRRKSI